MRIVSLISACVLLSACQERSSRPLDTASIQAEIDAATARLAHGIASGQLDSSATVLTDDHYSMPPNAPPLPSREQWLAWSKGALVGGQWSSVTTPESRLYGDSITVDRGRYVNTFTPAPGAPKTARAFSDTGKYVWIWKKTPSGWRVAQAIWNSNAPAQP